MDSLKNISETVAETLLITLFCRAIETESDDPVIIDYKAVEIVKQLGEHYDFSKLKKVRNFKQLAVTMSMRARRFDYYVQQFLAQAPDGIVVNIGCGLDTRFHRLGLDKGQVEWYDLDLPEVITIKKHFFQESERYLLISSSVLDLEWMTPLSQKNRPLLFLAEGVFMYLYEEDVKRLILQLQATFPGSELACEVTNIFWVKRMQQGFMKRRFQSRFHLGDDVTFHWGIKEGSEVESWKPGIQLLDEWTYFDEAEKKLGKMRFFGRFSLLRKSQWVVHFKLNAPP
ncbi:MAG: class I SAM-dependent methyltransferase [Candidatus Hodarchaeota archaeon]